MNRVSPLDIGMNREGEVEIAIIAKIAGIAKIENQICFANVGHGRKPEGSSGVTTETDDGSAGKSAWESAASNVLGLKLKSLCLKGTKN